MDSEAQAQDLLARAQKARSTDATAMNAESSRSHSVFTLCITGEHEEKGFKLLGSLNLVDLAGSERLARSQAEGQRQKETCAINKSLACLGDIFQVCPSSCIACVAALYCNSHLALAALLSSVVMAAVFRLQHSVLLICLQY